jgi:tetratricopeptide (TPR) repeat protein
MRQALSIEPSFARATLAKEFLDLLELSEDPARAVLARDKIEQLLQRDPNRVPAWMALATIREHDGQFADARKLYEEKILRIYPDFAPAQRGLAVLYAEHLSDDAKALEAGTKAREVFRDDADLSKLLGQAALRRKEYAKAVQLLKEAIDKRPDEADLFYCLGMAYQGLDRRDSCKRALQKALDLNLERGLPKKPAVFSDN